MSEHACILCNKPMRQLNENGPVSLPASDAFADKVFDLFLCTDDDTRAWVRRWNDKPMAAPEERSVLEAA